MVRYKEVETRITNVELALALALPMGFVQIPQVRVWTAIHQKLCGA